MRNKQDTQTKENVWQRALAQTLIWIRQAWELALSIVKVDPVYTVGTGLGRRSRS